jgi:RNA polymerase sigma-70 factor (ECF subfamily)
MSPFVASAGPAERGLLLGEHALSSDAAAEGTGPEKGAQVPGLEALFEAHYADVWRLLRRFGVRPSELDDAAQEVFWVAARRLADIRAGRERAFLYGVALRVASNVLRREKARPAATDLDSLPELRDKGPSPEQELEQRQARDLLDAVLLGLPLELRSVFILAELEGVPVKEIAELEEIPLGTASSRLRRAREEFSAAAKRLRAAIGARGGAF